MAFRIATSVSRCYSGIAAACMPSWFANAGADEIQVDHYTGTESGERVDIWLDNLMTRCRNMQDQVRQAVRNRNHLLLLDADCVVLKPLRGGFADDKPFSVAFWPSFNMGAVWLNCSLDWPFVEFYDELVGRALDRCRELKQKRDLNAAGDQDIMWEMLWAREECVHKLDHWEWNFRCSPRTSDERIRTHKDAIRILHLRMKSFGFNIDHPRLQFYRDTFPGAFAR